MIRVLVVLIKNTKDAVKVLNMDKAKDLLLIETIVKVAAINKLLVKKGLLTDDEVHTEMASISKDLVEEFKKLSPDILSSTIKNS